MQKSHRIVWEQFPLTDSVLPKASSKPKLGCGLTPTSHKLVKKKKKKKKSQQLNFGQWKKIQGTFAQVLVRKVLSLEIIKITKSSLIISLRYELTLAHANLS